MKIFAMGALRMLLMMALIITCIGAITTGDGFFIATGVVSLIVVAYEAFLLIKNTKHN